MLARALPSILPKLTIDEALDITRIYSICDMLPADTPLVQTRPFRSPHHTVSHAGLVGGGSIPRPGEISLAHRGVLFLDELPEFSSRALEVLREILRLYDFSDSAVTRQRIAGIVGLRSRRIVRRVARGGDGGFARGLEAELEFDPSQYTGTGVFLFASVLERFLGLYASVNSFTQTVARVRQQPGVLKRWPPRAGDLPLL